MKKPIFLDCHSTTPVDPRVLEVMLPHFAEEFGNPASRTHPFGWAAGQAVEDARARVARSIGARPREIVFTSGATESNNLAIHGALSFYRDRGNHVVISAAEHSSVRDPVLALARARPHDTAEVSVVPVDRTGLVDPADVEKVVTDRTVLVSIILANNEIGTIQSLAPIGGIVHRRGALLHTDATQAIGKIPVDVEALGVDLLSCSAHKLYGPKGAGALWIRGRNPRVRLHPLLEGGGHERGLRSGTLNVPAIVGFGMACEIATTEMDEEAARVGALRDRLVEGLFEGLEGVTVNGHPERRLPGNANLCFSHIEAESLLMALQDDVALSSGSACTSATLEPSHVLRAIGLDDRTAQGAVRFGLGRFTTAEEIDHVVGRVVAEVTRLRGLSPHWVARRDRGRPATVEVSG